MVFPAISVTVIGLIVGLVIYAGTRGFLLRTLALGVIGAVAALLLFRTRLQM